MYCFLTPTAAEPPTGLNVEPVSPTSIRVSWTAPLSRATVTGYQIYYRADGDWESVAVDANITNYTLSNLQNGLTYNITMVALSIHLPSSVVGPQTLGNPLFSFFPLWLCTVGYQVPMVWGHLNSRVHVLRLIKHAVSAHSLSGCVNNKHCGSCEYQCGYTTQDCQHSCKT